MCVQKFKVKRVDFFINFFASVKNMKRNNEPLYFVRRWTRNLKENKEAEKISFFSNKRKNVFCWIGVSFAYITYWQKMFSIKLKIALLFFQFTHFPSNEEFGIFFKEWQRKPNYVIWATESSRINWIFQESQINNNNSNKRKPKNECKRKCALFGTAP